ncbi:PTS transporter subunit EIIB [Spiroplasma turonicum]|uniref:PTS system trehalose-specific IIBC component n=1 Tax=Spiroplasma turonicum TaxID=216946 RepID=A0A0K1P7S0_9MOLU|nr:PTS transporter subunit EIIB [Spiroplasma turonicum]AKU79932.1 PTS system trehalose-specific IIBC component [Spiroplasma turonicum]ALX70945.1 PTS system, trehalose-specific IIBC component [Spiroplasma turonicum]
MIKKKYIDAVQDLFNKLGGYDNIISFTHCMTRMRFHLKNWSIINDNEIKNNSFTTGIKKNESSNEYQVIIGMDVADFYQTFCKINNYDIDGKTIINQEINKLEKNDEFKTTQSQEIQSLKNRFKFKGITNKCLTFISKVFSPIVYPLIGYGLLLTIWSLLTVEWNGEGSSVSESVHFFGQFASILNVLTNTFSLFITIAVGYTVFKAMRCTSIYGILIAVVLTAPGLINMGDVKPSTGQTILGEYPGWTLFGDEIKYPFKINFNGLMVPMIGVAIFGAYMERWTSKISNTTAKNILSPILIIGVTFIFAIFIVAPIGMLFTNYLSIGVNWLSTNYIAKYIALPLLGALYGPLVITGLHHSLTPIILQGQATYGATIIQGLCTLSNVSQGVATIAFVVLNRKIKQLRELGISNGVSAIVGGITEPSLFTVNLKHLYPLISCSIGVFCGSIVLVASNTYALQGASSIFGYLMFQHKAPVLTGVDTWVGGGFLWGAISILVSCLVTFMTTILLGKIKYFSNRSRNLLLEDFNEDIFELRLMKKTDYLNYLKNKTKQIKK